jgi:hypothetical protein
LVVGVDADRDQSVFLLHNGLSEFHPKVRQLIVAASNTGDLEEAAAVAGLNAEQVALVLPRIKAYLRRGLAA